MIDPNDDNAVNDAIDAWHDGDHAVPLHEHLGWTREAYRAWVEQRPIVPILVADDADRIAVNEALTTLSVGRSALVLRPSEGVTLTFVDFDPTRLPPSR
jgi:hypothetical protein